VAIRLRSGRSKFTYRIHLDGIRWANTATTNRQLDSICLGAYKLYIRNKHALQQTICRLSPIRTSLIRPPQIKMEFQIKVCVATPGLSIKNQDSAAHSRLSSLGFSRLTHVSPDICVWWVVLWIEGILYIGWISGKNAPDLALLTKSIVNRGNNATWLPIMFPCSCDSAISLQISICKK